MTSPAEAAAADPSVPKEEGTVATKEEKAETEKDTDKDAGAGHALGDFINQIENYTPTIPDSVVAHYLNQAGFESQDPRLIRLFALASQKYLSDIANDALQHCKMRTTTQVGQGSKAQKVPKEKKFVMTMEDLAPALQDYGVGARKPNYFV